MQTHLSHTAANLRLITQLLMRRRPRMNRERLTIAHIGQIADELKVVHNLTTRAGIPLYAKTQDTAKAALEVFLGQLMALMAL